MTVTWFLMTKLTRKSQKEPIKKKFRSTARSLAQWWHIRLLNSGDCPFKSEPSPTYADACGEVTGCAADCQKFSMCSTRGGSPGNVHYIHRHKKWIRQKPTLALNPRGDVTRNPKQGYWQPPKRTCMSTKNFIKERKKFGSILHVYVVYLLF